MHQNHSIDKIRIAVSARLDPIIRSALGQYMTPWAIARFMASLFSQQTPATILDAGAGVGSLSVAFLDRFPKSRIEAWEIDPMLRDYLTDSLSDAKATLHGTDFIEDATNNIQFGLGTRFSHAILNPPYKKINSNSRHRALLRELGIETVNLYTAFLALAILLMENGGEIVAIIPRSFCNGAYYRSFRELMLSKCALDHIHVFESRKRPFRDDDVLQENVIIKLVRGKMQSDVVVSESHDGALADYHEATLPFDRIVKPSDKERYIHIPSVTGDEETHSPLFVHSTSEIGIEICTGPVIDFRLREHCRPALCDSAVPLLYAHHFSDGVVSYPKMHKKPSAILVNDETRRWLMPSGCYVVTKRFSSKEEKKRVVAFVFDAETLPCELVGFENHLNVFHFGKRGLDREIAYGLTVFLNSTVVDNHFRVFSGHTQVNATDLRNMRYPSREQLREFGRIAMTKNPSQSETDAMIKGAEKQYGYQGHQTA
ncbi:MAG: Eco57I restriction-modification methylase domain-containing protein [Nitrosospira sp.]